MKMSGVHAQPQGPAFDIVLLLHVGCVLAGLAIVVTSAATAARLRRLLRAGRALPAPVVRYFRPGVNWAGRLVYGIPVFGFALLAMSHGAYALADGWVAIASAPGDGPEAEPEAKGAPTLLRDAQLMAWSAAVALVLLLIGTALMVAQP
jgi:hypothetical protein